MSIGFWNKLLIAGLILASAGCQPKSRIRDDPFLPTAGKRGPDANSERGRDPSADARDDFRARPERDLARGVSTSPATDDDYAAAPRPRERDNPRERADRNVNDPLVNAERQLPEKSQAIGNRVNSREASYARNDVAKNRSDGLRGAADERGEQAVQFEQIRRRLDKLGAKNICLEPYERGTDEMSFRCEVPVPGANDRVRVFEAHSKDEIKLMVAITEAAEKWVSEQRN